jgi:hypothetical protein
MIDTAPSAVTALVSFLSINLVTWEAQVIPRSFVSLYSS